MNDAGLQATFLVKFIETQAVYFSSQNIIPQFSLKKRLF